MCRIYSSTDPDLYANTTRSVRMAGLVTSVRLENKFWSILDEIAHDEGITTPQFISKLYEEVVWQKGEVKNLSSLLRVVCTVYLTQQLTATTESKAVAGRGLPLGRTLPL